MFVLKNSSVVRSAVVRTKELRLSAFRQSTPVDSFLCQETVSSVDGNKSFRVTSDIFMLFNQQRLDKLTRSALLQHFDSMSQGNSVLSAARSKLTDDQLCQFVKSRYIQSPSELMAWTSYLMDNYDSEIASVNAQLAEQKAKEEALKQQADQVASAEPAQSA